MGAMTFQFHVVVFLWSIMLGVVFRNVYEKERKTKVCELLRLQKTETAIFIYIFSSLANLVFITIHFP